MRLTQSAFIPSRGVLMLCLILTIFSLKSNGQSAYNITAKVVNQADSSLFGNALILKASDSSLINGVYFEDGELLMEDVSEKSILVKVRCYGFDDQFIPVNNPDLKDVDFGKLTMTPRNDTIGTVEIFGTIPLFEPSPTGSVVVNVKETMLSASTSVLDILAKSPGVLVTDGGVTVVGKGVALLYLNGKQITIDRLKSIPVNQVKNIEIITNPSAKYDASGMAVINITTVVNYSEGFQGQIVQNFTFAKFFLSYTELNLNYQKGKWSFIGNYGLDLGKDWSELELTNTLNNVDGVFQSHTNSTNIEKYGNISNYLFGVGYRLNDHSNLSVQYDGIYNVFDNINTGLNRIESPFLDNDIYIDVENNGTRSNINNSFSVNYDNTVDTLGSSVFFGGQYSIFENVTVDDINETFTQEEAILSQSDKRNEGGNSISLFSAQADYNKIFKNESSMEVGLKYLQSKNVGNVLFSVRQEGTSDYIVDPDFTNGFDYKEDILAGYSQYNGSIGETVNYSVGLRAEQTIVKGYSVVLEQTVVDSSYLNFFPNVQIGKTFGEKWSANLSYSSRIMRPVYQWLDPFVWYKDSLTSSQGNPLLVPAKSKSLEANVVFKGYSLKLGYTNTQDAFRRIVIPGDNGSNSVIQKFYNVQQLNSAYAALTIPVSVKRVWTSYNTISLRYDKIIDDRPIFKTTNSIPQLYFYSYNRVKLKEIVSLELIAEYEGEYKEGINHINPTYMITLGASKNFFNGKLRTRIVVSDVFKSYKRSGSGSVGTIELNYANQLNTHYYRFSVTYKFGKLKNVNYTNTTVGDDGTNRIDQ
ncbi:MAG: outer membrane beta-barrel protein [Crocinitomix sp.]|nr:outer membrane beta-barrel protein [Crocinitomix sp.]